MSEVPFPPHMCAGSRGPHVSVLQAFLTGVGVLVHELDFNRRFGKVTEDGVDTLQANLGLNEKGTTGDFEEATRNEVKALYGFDFEAICRTIPGTTGFVQPDHTVILWTSPADTKDLMPDEVTEKLVDLAAKGISDHGTDSSSGGDET